MSECACITGCLTVFSKQRSTNWRYRTYLCDCVLAGHCHLGVEVLCAAAKLEVAKLIGAPGLKSWSTQLLLVDNSRRRRIGGDTSVPKRNSMRCQQFFPNIASTSENHNSCCFRSDSFMLRRHNRKEPSIIRPCTGRHIRDSHGNPKVTVVIYSTSRRVIDTIFAVEEYTRRTAVTPENWEQ